MFVVEMSFSKKGRKTAGGPRVTNRDVTNTTAESVQQVHTAQIYRPPVRVSCTKHTGGLDRFSKARRLDCCMDGCRSRFASWARSALRHDRSDTPQYLFI